MEKIISTLFTEPTSTQCDAVSYFGIGIDADNLMAFCKKYQKSDDYGKIIMDCIKGEYDYETVDELDENESYIDSCCGRDIVSSVANKFGLDGVIYFTPGDEDYYLIGVPLGNGNGTEELDKITQKMESIKNVSDLFGVKFGFYSAIAWIDF